jgi:metallophosphoesterase superfamily enzyme
MATSPPPRLQIRPDVWLDARRAVWLAQSRLLLLADLHWGYVASHRAQGNLLPAWGDEDIVVRLRSLIADYQPAEMIWLGDSLHTLSGREAADDFLRASACPVTLLAGNHDFRWTRAAVRSLSRDQWFFHHGDRAESVPDDAVEVIGHHHPALAWSDGAGGRLKLPALVDGPRRLILPAFSPWAAGTPWNSLLQPGETLWAIAPRRIFPVPSNQLQKVRT